MIVAAAALEEESSRPKPKWFAAGVMNWAAEHIVAGKSTGTARSICTGRLSNRVMYFYTVGRMLGVDRIAQYAAKFGLGDPTGIELPHEKGLSRQRIGNWRA